MKKRAMLAGGLAEVVAGHVRFMMQTQGGACCAVWPWADIYSAFSAN